MSRRSGPPEYKVYRSRRKPLARGGDLDALRQRLSRNRDGDGPRPPRDRPPITPGRVLKWVALALAGWLALSLVLFLISAQTQEGVSAETERALSSEGSLFTGSNILVLGSDVRTGRVDRQDPVRARPLRHDHARPLRLRQRSQAVDPARRGGRHPGSRNQQDQRRLRARRAGAHDRDRGVVPRARPEGEPPRRGGLQELPGLHRLARRGDREQQVAHLLAPVRQLLEGPALQEGRDRSGRAACARLRAGAEEQLCARGGRPRPRGSPAAGAERDRLEGEVAEHIRAPPVGQLARPRTRRRPGRR